MEMGNSVANECRFSLRLQLLQAAIGQVPAMHFLKG